MFGFFLMGYNGGIMEYAWDMRGILIDTLWRVVQNYGKSVLEWANQPQYVGPCSIAMLNYQMFSNKVNQVYVHVLSHVCRGPHDCSSERHRLGEGAE